MRVDAWCFCNGVGKSERLKAAIFSTKCAAMAKLSASSSSSSTSGCSAGGGRGEGSGSGTGFLIHRNLLLTTHVNLPSVNAAEAAEIRLQNGVPATLVPHRFFITSSVLDLTIVGLDTIEGDAVSSGHQPQYFKLCSKPNLELGNVVYLLGHAEKQELFIGEGKVVITTDNLIKFSTEGFTWSPGSAGFDSQGNLAFMICDPMKLATSPNTKSSTNSSSSSTSWKKDLPMQFGIPLPVIFDWLNQHWEGSLDDLSKPKLPLMRLVSGGHRGEHSSASFSMRRVFKESEESDGPTSSSNAVSNPREQPGQGSSQMSEGEKVNSQPLHAQGIPTPEIYESPKVTSNPVKKKESSQIPLLDINFPPRGMFKPAEKAAETLDLKDHVKESHSQGSLKEEKLGNIQSSKEGNTQCGPFISVVCRDPNAGNLIPAVHDENEEDSSSGSVGDGQSEVRSSSPVLASEVRDDQDDHCSSEGETLYSAETAESRNYTSPREGRFQPVGRSQSCVSYSRWGPVHRNPVARKSPLEKQRSFMQPRKTYSQGAPPSHKTMDYFSPTVSSIMKKRNNMEQPVRPRPTAAVHSSPRWNF